ncbi:AraC family transcriptional regulator [Rhizobium sp. PP-F2F-G20b]|nr:AraC family transcriptional regulator [Rhizobium sp. PP-F2F-G20b]
MLEGTHVVPRGAKAHPGIAFDTRDVAVNDRIDYWEDRCAERVVGLRCTSMSESGLEARFEYCDFGSIKMIDITGNQQVIERSPSLLRLFEKDSVFLTFLRKGSAFVNRAESCSMLGEGDVVIYDTNKPYMHGFPAQMRHVIYEIPGEDFRKRFPRWELNEPVRFDALLNPTRIISRALREVVETDLSLVETTAQRQSHEERLWTVLETAHAFSNGKVRSAYHTAVRTRVSQYIETHLHDPELCPTGISREMGMSLRQLNRLFEGDANTLASLILTRRLQKCRADLARPGPFPKNVSDIAFNWGFRNLSHFSKRFRDEFGISPSGFAEMARRSNP